MIWLLVRHSVKDYGAWKPVFDAHGSVREEAGASGGYVMRDPDDPNLISVALAFEGVDAARAFVASPTLRDAMAEAGVIGDPEISYFDVLEQLSFAPAEVLAA